MADSLFDKRYRYDYIYPRGRSGETLRAVDTHDDDRPVVIKRPAAPDAPPIRNRQEVSIANERKALLRLSGHPVLAELVGEGQFLVGGMVHQYIVIERAEGVMLADDVRERASSGERLPLLETYVIVDALLDLLHTAHSKGIVYNDVDAKHLFWDRDRYALKVIDWGNAVFLEDEEMNAQGISRQTDVYQVGELLYYIVTGGRRADIPRDASADFLLSFGEDSARLPAALQALISKAIHPNPRLRYPSIAALRADLASLRAPLEKERNTVVANVSDKLKRADLSKSELRTLEKLLEPALRADSGYPPARQAHAQIVDRLRDLTVSADLDAVRIYLNNGTWGRASALLAGLREQAGSQTIGLVNWLADAVELIESSSDADLTGARAAIDALFVGDVVLAVQTLLAQPPADRATARLHWLLAERISAHFPDVLLLRPNLYRLNESLHALKQEGYDTSEALAILQSIDKTLDSLQGGNVDLPDLRSGYASVAEQLALASPLLQTFSLQHQLTSKQLSLNALDRAMNAAMALTDNMHVIGKQATASPRDALNALDASRTIDTLNSVFDDIQYMLTRLYERLQACQTYVPAADGSDLAGWLKATQNELAPFAARLFDDMLTGFLAGLQTAEAAWARYREAVIQGNRDDALGALDSAQKAVAVLAPALSAWLRSLRGLVDGAQHIERHAVPNPLGRALADGWEAFDKGRMSEAELLGQQAYQAARSDTEQFVARRLQSIAQLCREWVERGGVNSRATSATAHDQVEQLFTARERGILQHFTEQMPSIETYLKAMGRGLVDVYDRQSSGALRVLFFKYVLLGTLDAHDKRLGDAAFWLEAAERTLGDAGARHPAARALHEFIARQHDLNAAQALFERFDGKHALPELENTRRQLENNPQAKLLTGAVQSLRELALGLRDWSDGDFRSAGLRLESALKEAQDCERSAGINLAAYRAWVMALMKHCAALWVQFREMRQRIEQRPDQPDHTIFEAHHDFARVTQNQLGETYAATLRQWRDTYDAFLAAYTAEERRSKRLERFNELFKAMFIDRHPAYGLYQHWYDVLEQSPEFPAPPTDEPLPRMAEAAPTLEVYQGTRYVDEARPKRPLPKLAIVGAVGVLLVVVAVVGVLLMAQNLPAIAVTISPTPNDVAGASTMPPAAQELGALLVTTPIPTSDAPFVTPTPLTQTPRLTTRASDTPSLTPTAPTATPTLTATPSSTFTPSATFTPSITPTPSDTPTVPPLTPTPLPPQGLQGTQDLLAIFNRTDAQANPLTFSPLETGYRLGVGEAWDEPRIRVFPSLDALEGFYGNNAATRLRRSEAEFVLRTFNPSVVGAEDVYFGMQLASANDGNSIGIMVQVVGQNVVNVYRMVNEERQFLTQKSVNAVIARLRLERDINNGSVSLYYNDELLGGTPTPFLNAEAPVLPVLFVRGGGVVVGVSYWRVGLR